MSATLAPPFTLPSMGRVATSRRRHAAGVMSPGGVKSLGTTSNNAPVLPPTPIPSPRPCAAWLRHDGEGDSVLRANSPRGISARGYEGNRGAGRLWPISLIESGCGHRRPTRHKGSSAAIPRIASLPGASPTFSRWRQGGHEARYMAPAACAGPLRASPSAHVCAPGQLERAAGVYGGCGSRG